VLQRRDSAGRHVVPLPVPSSAASIKLDIEGKQYLAALGSSIRADRGLLTWRVCKALPPDEGLEYLVDKLQRPRIACSIYLSTADRRARDRR
jgi:hypothetical protein